MAYAIKRKESVAEAVRRIACEQVDGALGNLEHPEDMEEAVHDCRKRCKKMRGLVRLVRPAIGDAYRPANEVFRDAARELSGIRDSHVLLVTFDGLLASDGGRDDLDDVRTGLQAKAEETTLAGDEQAERIVRARRLLEAGRAQIDEWEFSGDGFGVLAGGLKRTYRRGRKALRRAVASPSPARFHDWRKEAKYSWYHVRLLERTAPSVLGPLAGLFHDLGDALGDAHDLVVFEDHLRASPGDFAGSVEPVVALAERFRADLERRATRLGARLYAEPPGAFAARMGAYWDAQRRAGKELEVGELAELFPAA
jgi:CHAD domain-containing protein